MKTENYEEGLLRVHCILKHCQNIERDGLANSLGHFQKIEEDARALEDLFLDTETSQPVHI